MREILFRALSMCTGEHWLYGQIRHYARNTHKEKWTIYDPSTGIETDIVEETIGQYIGLKDNNGIMVFEGDIVTHPKYVKMKGIVKYMDMGFIVEWRRDGVIEYSSFSNSAIFNMKPTVIGNIHDNPELLKGD